MTVAQGWLQIRECYVLAAEMCETRCGFGSKTKPRIQWLSLDLVGAETPGFKDFVVLLIPNSRCLPTRSSGIQVAVADVYHLYSTVTS